jgi:hypothetical protein
MKPWIIWLAADAERPVGVKRPIANQKRMLIIFWAIHGITPECWLPKDSTLDSPFVCEEALSPLAQKTQRNSKKPRKPLTLIRINKARVHTPRATQERLDFSRFKRTPEPPQSPDTAPSEDETRS